MSEMSEISKQYRAEIPGREFLQVEIDSQGQEHLQLIVAEETLKLVQSLRAKSQKVSEWPMPEGNNSSAILVRELILKVRGQWVFPLTDPELCHCRAVPAAKVDQAIVSGAHSIEKVRRMTSANTACGTCMPEVEKLLKFRLVG